MRFQGIAFIFEIINTENLKTKFTKLKFKTIISEKVNSLIIFFIKKLGEAKKASLKVLGSCFENAN